MPFTIKVEKRNADDNDLSIGELNMKHGECCGGEISADFDWDVFNGSSFAYLVNDVIVIARLTSSNKSRHQ